MPDEDQAVTDARKRNENDLLARQRAARDKMRLQELDKMLADAQEAEERLLEVERKNGGKLL